jgi:diguanylate cyclase (GGDEF)-like protein
MGDATFSVTVSIGLAAHRPGEEAAQTLLRADRALYNAKVEGRNRIRVGAGDAVIRDVETR